ILDSANLEPHLAEMAHHFLAGGTPVREKAIEYAKRAGDRRHLDRQVGAPAVAEPASSQPLSRFAIEATADSTGATPQSRSLLLRLNVIAEVTVERLPASEWW